MKILKILCLFDYHEFKPTKGFFTEVIDANSGKHLRHDETYTGLQCSRCHKRKLRRNKEALSSSITVQNAYDWLNTKPWIAELSGLLKSEKPQKEK